MRLRLGLLSYEIFIWQCDHAHMHWTTFCMWLQTSMNLSACIMRFVHKMPTQRTKGPLKHTGDVRAGPKVGWRDHQHSANAQATALRTLKCNSQRRWRHSVRDTHECVTLGLHPLWFAACSCCMRLLYGCVGQVLRCKSLAVRRSPRCLFWILR